MSKFGNINFQPTTSAYMAMEAAKAFEENRRIEMENNAKKDKALFDTAQASIEQKELLMQQLAEVKQQNALLKENYATLKELYEMTKTQAESSEKDAKKSRRFGWISFIVGTAIGAAGVIVGIIF